MNKSKPPSTFRLIGGLFLGLLALVVSAFVFTSTSGRDLLPIFFALLFGTCFTGTILLVWLARWAMRNDGRTGQFGIGTLLMLTGLAAVYLGFVRWLIDQSGPQKSVGHTEDFITVCITSVILMAFSLIPLLSMAESLVWLAALMVRWGPVRRVLFGREERKEE